MIRNIALAAGFVIALAAPAFADCEEAIGEVMQALETAEISEADREIVQRSIVEANQDMPEEDACQEALVDAKKILGLPE
jgi:hypothetical protein